mmetsp:Transcript_122023/g.390166  ORF Transcript_122023/g.390166 Transcript_122023/m.390166 type:complete len:266 (+) Transcript_122023:1304-2101(+)
MPRILVPLEEPDDVGVVHLAHDQDLLLDVVQRHSRPGFLHLLDDAQFAGVIPLRQVGRAEGAGTQLLFALKDIPDALLNFVDEELPAEHRGPVEGAAPEQRPEELHELPEGEGLVVVHVKIFEERLGHRGVHRRDVQLPRGGFQDVEELAQLQLPAVVHVVGPEDVLCDSLEVGVCEELQSPAAHLRIDFPRRHRARPLFGDAGEARRCVEVCSRGGTECRRQAGHGARGPRRVHGGHRDGHVPRRDGTRGRQLHRVGADAAAAA